MKKYWRDMTTALHGVTAVAVAASMVAAPMMPAFADNAGLGNPTTPIKHIIIIIGENRSFDHVFATYKPKAGQTVDNLLSKGIVTAAGTPGVNFKLATQRSAVVQGRYAISPTVKTAYTVLPPAMTDGAPSAATNTNPPPFATLAAVTAVENGTTTPPVAGIHDGLPTADFKLLTTGATGLTSDSVDTRTPNATKLPSGPFQLSSKTLPYDSYTASPVHRFYQMWQQTDCSVAHGTATNPSGCLSDLFPFVETTVGTGGNGAPQVAGFTDETTGEGSASMGFWNVAAGDVPYFKSLADTYTLSDNFHQSVMGGTGANHIALGTGLAMYYSNGKGAIATPPSEEIENPNPQGGTNNWWTQDGYSGGSYSNCSNENAPGVKEVTTYLATLPYTPSPRCKEGAYYLLNNYNPGYNGDGTINTSTFTIPPSAVPTIGDTLNTANISWAYYGAGWDAFSSTDPAINTSDAASLYCNICNPFLYSTQIMASATQRTTHLKDVPDFYTAIATNTLPAVSFIKPDGLLDGHPASSKLDLYEAFVSGIVTAVQGNKDLWADTAILITEDEGGGYYDSGYIQPLDFFGDGTRIPALMVSQFSAGGKVSHVYGDHVSFLKFVEKNWNLPTVAEDTRDNYPNPITTASNPYVPLNSPAIGDLTDMFDFPASGARK
jgi:phospholipase C